MSRRGQVVRTGMALSFKGRPKKRAVSGQGREALRLVRVVFMPWILLALSPDPGTAAIPVKVGIFSPAGWLLIVLAHRRSKYKRAALRRHLGCGRRQRPLCRQGQSVSMLADAPGSVQKRVVSGRKCAGREPPVAVKTFPWGGYRPVSRPAVSSRRPRRASREVGWLTQFTQVPG